MNPECVIVGNGSTLLGSGLGPLIDTHRHIIRFNAFQTTGHEADVGTRSTHWFTVMHGNPSDPRTRLPWKEVWTHSWERIPSRCKTFATVRDVMKCPVHKVPHTHLEEMSRAADTRYRAWSTGALAVWAMAHYTDFETINLAGFDWWTPHLPHHYSDHVERGPLHDPAEEYKLISHLRDQGRITLLT